MSVCDQRAANQSSTLGGLVDTFGYYLQNGYVSLGFLGGAAIDKYGGVNVTSVGDYYKPGHRFTGSGGNSDIGTMAPPHGVHHPAGEAPLHRAQRLHHDPRVVVLGLQGRKRSGSPRRKSGRARPMPIPAPWPS